MIGWGIFLVYLIVAAWSARRFMWYRWQNDKAEFTYSYQNGPEARHVGEGICLSLAWPLMWLWYGLTLGLKPERLALAPKNVRHAEQLEAARERIAELEREVGV